LCEERKHENSSENSLSIIGELGKKIEVSEMKVEFGINGVLFCLNFWLQNI